ncbi:aspartate/glutamate racemase family protein [Flavobacteriaceae bacterium TP-CH-4]|uniref:Aspartate/glutamate racemase family protein n=1 Tax=Pelagihabitans pacificus TaxID=2696054 RepID=A0A967AUP0_9FLAO|nr:aspartate/glutamate racemase family protein [Pelagihabitans pacificus]NHF60719.1 aspartate/glutamate racemase family protein [Pelagihabitans pacificus]
MKTIGLIGGMSWESSIVYYESINRKVKEILGGHHSAKILLYSVDFAEIEALQHVGSWNALNQKMVDAAQRLEKAGADFIILCTNTMHLCSNAIKQHTKIPFLHIALATGEEIAKIGLQKIGLLGTKFTMEEVFYKGLLEDDFGLEVLVPETSEREEVHAIIYNELVHGKMTESSRERYKLITENLQSRGAEGVILGCTEIGLLLSENDVSLPVFDTTKIHAHKAVEWALGD